MTVKTPKTLVRKRSYLLIFILLGVLVILFFSPKNVQKPLQAELKRHPVYSTYAFKNTGPVINIGVQPLYLPTSLITEVMAKDKILRKAIQTLGMKLRFFAFYKGDDVNYFLKTQDIDVGVGGSMPALSAATRMDILIPILLQQGFTSIVAKQPVLTNDLKKIRIGYPHGSIAHYVVLDILSNEGGSKSFANTVSMEAHELGPALFQGKIDAFAAWEPIPAMAMKHNMNLIIVYQQVTKGYLYFARELYDQHPKAAREIVASVIRAFNWISLKTRNLVAASQWSIDAGEKLTNKKILLSANEIANLAEKDILGLTYMPEISDDDLNMENGVHKEFLFLKKMNKIPSKIKWEKIRDSFDGQILESINSDHNTFRLNQYDYEPDEN